MTFPRFAAAALLLPLAAAAQITPAKPMPPIVHVHIDTRGNQGTIPARLFGSFIEPIDNSINNGIMAEILTNGSLEPELWNHAMLEPMYREQPELIDTSNESGIPLPWLRLDPRAGNHYDLHVGQAANSWQSLTLMGSPGALVGIMQRVYLPVPRALRYNVSFYARHVSGPTQLTVSLRTAPSGSVPGDPLVTASVEAPAAAWTKYTTTLTLQPSQVQRLQPVHFALAVTGDERVEIDQISLKPADAVDNLFDPEVLAMSQSMHMTELRLGGNFSSYYHWQDGIGDPDKRLAMKNIAWGIPEYNNFGTDEFLAYCRLTNAIPQFNLNEGSGSPAEAADWVQYIRTKYQGPLILELGNELYGKWQIGAPTLDEVAARTLAFRKALEPFAAERHLYGHRRRPQQLPKVERPAPHPAPRHLYDLLTTHYIVGTNHLKLSPGTPDIMAAAAYAVPFAVGADFDAMQAQMNATPGYQGHTAFAVTEWLFNNKGPGERNFVNISPSSRNEGGAVMIAAAYNTFFRHNAEIKLVDMTGLMEFAGIWKRKEQVFASPAWYVFKMYAPAKDQMLLPVTTDTGTYNVANGIEGYANVADVPLVDITATRSPDNRTLTLYCVNRSLTDDAATEFDLASFTPAPTAQVEQITAPNRLVLNDEQDPHRVLPTSTTLNLTGPRPTVTLPHESVTVIHLTRQITVQPQPLPYIALPLHLLPCELRVRRCTYLTAQDTHLAPPDHRRPPSHRPPRRSTAAAAPPPRRPSRRQRPLLLPLVHVQQPHRHPHQTLDRSRPASQRPHPHRRPNLPLDGHPDSPRRPRPPSPRHAANRRRAHPAPHPLHLCAIRHHPQAHLLHSVLPPGSRRPFPPPHLYELRRRFGRRRPARRLRHARRLPPDCRQRHLPARHLGPLPNPQPPGPPRRHPRSGLPPPVRRPHPPRLGLLQSRHSHQRRPSWPKPSSPPRPWTSSSPPAPSPTRTTSKCLAPPAFSDPHARPPPISPPSSLSARSLPPPSKNTSNWPSPKATPSSTSAAVSTATGSATASPKPKCSPPPKTSSPLSKPVAKTFDQQLTADMTQVGGPDYAYLTALLFRQTLAAHKLVADVDGTPMLFSKENDSNGCIDTVDVTYPSSPFFLFFNPRLLQAQIDPVMRYAELPRWRFPFAPHDLGTFPLANGQVYGGGELNEDDQMPVEESGNLLIMIAALGHAQGNYDYARPHMAKLTQWAAYLEAKGLDPENQLSTDDFSGHLAHNTNLSIKAIEALGAFAEIARGVGDKPLAEHYSRLAHALPAKWEAMALDGDHYKLAFDQPNTWSQKYNLVWDNILDLHLFSPKVMQTDWAYYQKHLEQYGLPLDNRKDITKLDWQVWTATLGTPAQSQDLIHRLVVWADATPSRVPTTDFYDARTGKQQSFQARSVVGGIFIKALANPALAAKWRTPTP